MSTDLLTSIEGPVARITFNRPQARNAVNQGMVTAMAGFLEKVAADDSVRCVVLTGAGEHFMAGGDVSGFGDVLSQSAEERRAAFLQRVHNAAPVFRHLLTMPQPVIASVRGACAGAAVGFAACCDFILAAESALFLVAHVHIGASPDGATTYALPRRVGTAKAMEMAMLGGRVSAQQALVAGLVNQLVPDAELAAATEKLAQQIVALPASSVRHIKSLINQSINNTLDRQLELEAEAFADCAASPNFVEGVSAFLEKRKAEFNK